MPGLALAVPDDLAGRAIIKRAEAFDVVIIDGRIEPVRQRSGVLDLDGGPVVFVVVVGKFCVIGTHMVSPVFTD